MAERSPVFIAVYAALRWLPVVVGVAVFVALIFLGIREYVL